VETRGADDWDVYYERGRKPKESIIKYEAARSEGDYRRKVLLARIMRDRGEGLTWCERCLLLYILCIGIKYAV